MKRNYLKEYNRIAALQNASGLIPEYPSIWREVNAEIITVLKTGKAEKLVEYMNGIKAALGACNERAVANKNNPGLIKDAVPVIVKLKMVQYALDKLYLSMATGQRSEKVRFSLPNGLLLQKLLFHRGFERKPVNLVLFKIIWPFITQKKLLMPLVSRKGIYCFFSKQFITRLAGMIGNRSCLEIGAGDGSLASLLKEEGVSVRATDNYSWSKYVTYPAHVEKLDAKEALARYAPEAVICAWPPPVNRFEELIFKTPSVQTYIAIGSRHQFASGNRESYAGQKGYTMRVDDKLSRLILPKENDNEVLVFNKQPI